MGLNFCSLALASLSIVIDKLILRRDGLLPDSAIIYASITRTPGGDRGTDKGQEDFI